MNPQLLMEIATERMEEVAREAEERRRAGLPTRRPRERASSVRLPRIHGAIRRLQLGS